MHMEHDIRLKPWNLDDTLHLLMYINAYVSLKLAACQRVTYCMSQCSQIGLFSE